MKVKPKITRIDEVKMPLLGIQPDTDHDELRTTIVRGQENGDSSSTRNELRITNDSANPLQNRGGKPTLASRSIIWACG